MAGAECQQDTIIILNSSTNEKFEMDLEQKDTVMTIKNLLYDNFSIPLARVKLFLPRSASAASDDTVISHVMAAGETMRYEVSEAAELCKVLVF